MRLVDDVAVPVHLSDWSDQPSVRIKCSQRWGSPWTQRSDLPEGVHEMDVDGVTVFYTFDSDKVTCSACSGERVCAAGTS